MKFLSPKIHGYIDYLTVAALVVIPMFFLRAEYTAAVMGLYVAAGALLLTSLITRYPLGIIKLVPFPVHGGIEFVAAPLLVAYPWIAGFADVPGLRNLYIGVGAALFVVWLVTDYRAAEIQARAQTSDQAVGHTGERTSAAA